MSKYIVTVILCFAAFGCACASQEESLLAVEAPAGYEPTDFDHEHARWSAVLEANVRDDRVDYEAIGNSLADMNAYLLALQSVGPEELASWTRDQRFAFWINVYNVYTVRLIVDNYPVTSIKDLGGTLLGRVFDRAIIPLPALHHDGKDENLSLNDVEHKILRARFPDARVHAAINCASESCPRLANKAFVAERLDDQLDAAMGAFVNDPGRNRFERDENRIYLSKIFDWFGSDFERDAGSVRAFVARFRDTDDRGWIESASIGYLDYSWKLNDVE